jgi:hypothetical protein
LFCSRSHCVFTLSLNVYEPSGDGGQVVRVSKLNVVDLAGSECVGRSKASAHETGHINKSLLALGLVIHELALGKEHVSYRYATCGIRLDTPVCLTARQGKLLDATAAGFAWWWHSHMYVAFSESPSLLNVHMRRRC